MHLRRGVLPKIRCTIRSIVRSSLVMNDGQQPDVRRGTFPTHTTMIFFDMLSAEYSTGHGRASHRVLTVRVDSSRLVVSAV
jgi:hypothetical protein